MLDGNRMDNNSDRAFEYIYNFVQGLQLNINDPDLSLFYEVLFEVGLVPPIQVVEADEREQINNEATYFDQMSMIVNFKSMLFIWVGSTTCKEGLDLGALIVCNFRMWLKAASWMVVFLCRYDYWVCNSEQCELILLHVQRCFLMACEGSFQPRATMTWLHSWI